MGIPIMTLEKGTRPNKFTRHLGDAIRKAREDKGVSQVDLANLINIRRATLSDMENGKTEPDAFTLADLAHKLEKPLSYFFPSFVYKEIKQEELTSLESELLIHFRKIWDEQLQRVAIHQVEVLSDFDPTKTLWDAVDLTISEKENEAKLQEIIEQRHKKNN
jgi:transcriptional regulator with XRE-family HTH domain